MTLETSEQLKVALSEVRSPDLDRGKFSVGKLDNEIYRDGNPFIKFIWEHSHYDLVLAQAECKMMVDYLNNSKRIPNRKIKGMDMKSLIASIYALEKHPIGPGEDLNLMNQRLMYNAALHDAVAKIRQHQADTDVGQVSQQPEVSSTLNLKPCPFCGYTASVLQGIGEWWARCDSCKSSAPMYGSKDGAIAGWNRRAQGEILVNGMPIEAIIKMQRMFEQCSGEANYPKWWQAVFDAGVKSVLTVQKRGTEEKK